MNRRDFASFLWFLVGWTAGGLVTGLMGWPWPLAFVPAIALAILVRTAPASWLWTRSGTGRRITPVGQSAAEIVRHAEARPAAGADTRRA